MMAANIVVVVSNVVVNRESSLGSGRFRVNSFAITDAYAAEAIGDHGSQTFNCFKNKTTDVGVESRDLGVAHMIGDSPDVVKVQFQSLPLPFTSFM